MVRSGIILPFQFRDCKKLLMIGVPEENRELSIWDLKNVVRAAFGIYNFEFRNKKIGFNIPDELLLHYLEQRHDLTNFVIEIGQAIDESNAKSTLSLSFESPTACTQKLDSAAIAVILPQKSNESTATTTSTTVNNAVSQNYLVPSCAAVNEKSPEASPLAHNAEDHCSSQHVPPAQKLRISQIYPDQRTPELFTQSIDPMDIIPKSEQLEMEMEPALHEQQLLHQHQHHQQHHHGTSPFFPNYSQGILGNAAAAASTITASGNHDAHAQQSFSPAMMNRFRRRGERMSKDQKELYVKYLEENPCMLTQRRNDIILEPRWNKLANLLNSVPQGAMKNVEEWKQTFDAWRYRVFMYTRYNSKLTGTAAQNPKNYKPLTPTDQRAYAMWTSHKNTTPQDFEKMDMFSNLDETQTDYDY